MARLDAPTALTRTEEPDARRYAEAVVLLREGRTSEARAEFEWLMRRARPAIARSAGRALGQLMMQDSDWAGLLALVRRGPGAGLYGALATMPTEVLHHPEEPLVMSAPPSLSGSPTVRVVVNGHEYWFWVDTGAGMSVVASDVAAATDVFLSDAQVDVGTPTSQEVSTIPAMIRDLRLGSVRVENHPVLVVDADALTFPMGNDTMKVDGILGWPLLRQLHLELDYAQSTLTVLPQTTHHTEVRNLFWLETPLVSGTSQGGMDLIFLLDTGAHQTVLFEEYLQRETDHKTADVSATQGGAGGFETSMAQMVYEVRFTAGGADLVFDEILATGNSFSSVVAADGVVGTDAGSGRTMVVDYPCGRFELRESDPP